MYRCALRQPSVASDADGYTFVPVTFPSPEEARFSPGSVPDLPSDDAEQVRLNIGQSTMVLSGSSDSIASFVSWK